MTLDAAARRLSEISGAPPRAYSTRDFGRDRNPEARSVVVPESRSRDVLQRLRSELGPNIIAFIGTTRWLGDELHPGGQEIVVADATSQFLFLQLGAGVASGADHPHGATVTQRRHLGMKLGGRRWLRHAGRCWRSLTHPARKRSRGPAWRSRRTPPHRRH